MPTRIPDGKPYLMGVISMIGLLMINHHNTGENFGNTFRGSKYSIIKVAGTISMETSMDSVLPTYFTKKPYSSFLFEV
jgi:hypothetical protein